MATATLETEQPLPILGGMIGNLSNLSAIRQIGILVGLAASVALGFILAFWTREPLLHPLPAHDKQTTFEIIQFLDQQKIPYQLESDGVLQIPQESFQKVQLQLASQGLGENESPVDTMLAKDTGFAVSQRLETARLMRMQELKLSRTIEKFSGVKAAEVHLAIPKESVFLREDDKARASVLLNLYSQRSLEPEQIRAMVDLVVGSVPGLDSTRVTITDQFGRLHHSGSATRDEVEATREFTESRKREAEIQQKIERVLAPIIGNGKFTVEAHVDMDFSETEQTQKIFNAELPALRSERTLTEQNANGGAQGVPGALSNQPPAPATAPLVANAGTNTASNNTSSTSNSGGGRSESERNFDHDTTIAHTRNQVGQVRRLTVSVGLDYLDSVPTTGLSSAPGAATAGTAPPAGAATGTVALPATAAARKARSAEEIASITKLVQSAIGYDSQRGDMVEIQSFPFISEAVPEAPVATPIYEQPWFQMLLKPAVALILGLALIYGMVRVLKLLISSGQDQHEHQSLRGLPEMPDMGLASDQLSLSASGATASMSLPPPVTTELDTVTRAKSVVQTDPALVAQVMKNWMERDV